MSDMNPTDIERGISGTRPPSNCMTLLPLQLWLVSEGVKFPCLSTFTKDQVMSMQGNISVHSDAGNTGGVCNSFEHGL